MAAVEIADYAQQLNSIAGDDEVDPTTRISQLRGLMDEIAELPDGEDRTSLIGQAQTYIGGLDLRREAMAISQEMHVIANSEDADIREMLIANGIATAEQLDEFLWPSHSSIAEARADGTLEEGMLGMFKELLHPRDRGGRWRDKPGVIKMHGRAGGTAPATTLGKSLTPTKPQARQLRKGRLPEAGHLYFNTDAAALQSKYGEHVGVEHVPLDKIKPIRARPEGIANAKPLMAKAALGEGDKRDPITLIRNPDGTHTVHDGNSTFANAKEEGWSHIPAMVVDSKDEAQAIETTMKLNKLVEKFPPDADGWHDVGSNVNAAADLLSSGAKVRLNQPREASVLLDELAKRVQAAKEAGQAAPNFDLCKVTVKNTNLFCAESKGIERVHMPQFTGIPSPGSPADGHQSANASGRVDLSQDFRKSLEDAGVKVEDGTELASHMKASQIELNGGKVAEMTKALDAGKSLGDDRIFISKDGYIVDGHHRWAAHVGHDLADNETGDISMPVSRVDMPITELLDAANKFTREQGIAGRGIHNEPEPPKSPGVLGMGSISKQQMNTVDASLKAMVKPGEDEDDTQTFASLDDLYAAAEKAQPEFESLLAEAVAGAGGEQVSYEDAVARAGEPLDAPMSLVGPLKKRDRAQQKIDGKYEGDHNRLNDVVRGTVVVPKLADMPAAMDSVRKAAESRGWQVKGHENRYLNPPPPSSVGPTGAGYRDVAVSLISPDGLSTELQFNTGPMFAAKEGEGHKLYERQRQIEEPLKQARAAGATDFDPSLVAELADLDRRSRALYQSAWEKSYGG